MIMGNFTIFKPLRFIATVFSVVMLMASSLQAQVNVASTAGTPTGTYATVSAAFAAINLGTHQGVINITISANTTEPAAVTALVNSGSGTALYSAINIKPSGNVTVNSAATPTTNRGLIELNGADNVTIDGDDPATPGVRNLTFQVATSATLVTAVIRFSSNSTTGTNGADNNTIKNCILIGSRPTGIASNINYGINISNYSTTSLLTAAASSINTVIENNEIRRCLRGIYALGSSTFPITGTVIRNNILGSATLADNIGQLAIYIAGSNLSGTAGAALIEGNDLRAGDVLAAGTASFAVTNVTGIELNTANSNIRVLRNNIHDIMQPSTGGWGAYGIHVTGAASCDNFLIANNFINNIVALKYSATNPNTYTSYGIRVSAGATLMRIINNTIVVAPSVSGTVVGYTSYGVGFTVTTPTVSQFLNNIVVNNNTGTGTYAMYSQTNSIWTNATINRNDYLAPNSGNVGFYNGANQTTLANWQAATGQDANSFNAAPNFVSANDLHITTAPTPLESGGAPTSVTLVTNDIDNQLRPGPVGSVNGGATNPDMGADEFDAMPIFAPVLTFGSITPINCTTAEAHPVTVSVTPGSGTVASVVLNYAFNGVAQTPITMTNTTGSTYTGTIPVASPVNASVTWNIVATNSFGLNVPYTGASYIDQSLLGVSAIGINSASPVCAGSPSNLSVSLTSLQPSVLYNTPGVSTPLADEDFGGVVITEGATTILSNTTTGGSLVGTIGTATGTPGSFSNFTAFGPFAMTAGNTYGFSLTSITQGGNYGNSMAIFIDYNRDGDFADAGEAVYLPTATVTGPHVESGTFTIPATALNGLTRMRVVCLEVLITGLASTSSWGEYEDYMLNISSPNQGGGYAPVITSAAWSNSTAVAMGTGNPYTINPIITDSYTALVTSLGCTVTSSATTVTALVLPTSPIATNSSQCGSAIPTASVASGAGTAGSGQYFWYNAATNGTALQAPPIGAYTNFYSNDFTNTTIGAGASLSGVASLTAVAGQLQLTPNLTSQLGGLTVDAGVNAAAYKVDFDFTTSPVGGADGFSYSFADDVNANSTAPTAEKGSGSKLKICFDAYDAVMPNQAGIYIVYNNTAATFNATAAGVLGYVGNTSWVGTANNHVTIETNANGQVTVTLNGTPIFTNIQLPAAYLASNKASWKHALAARTGGISMLQTFDNLVIQTAGYAPGSTTFGTPIAATTTLYVSELGTNGCLSTPSPLIVTVSNPDPVTFTAGLNPNICLGQSFTTTASSVNTAYAYTSTLASYTGSGISSSVIGTTIASTPTTAGVYPFTVTGTDGICTAVTTMTLTVNALPVLTSATATPTTACHNAVVNLAASSIVSGPQTLPAGYCTTNNSGGTGTFVNNLVFGTITNNSSATNPTAAPYYTNYNLATNVQPGLTYPLSITTSAPGTYLGAIISVWIDFNRDGVLAATEWQQVAVNQASGTTSITNITIPLNAQMGLTKMRIRTRGNGNINGAGDACTSMGSGETEDYLVNIQSQPAVPYSYIWNSTPVVNTMTGTTIVTNNTNAPTTQSWTVTATEAATGCINTMTTAPVTIQPAFLAPITTNSAHCGIQIPTASVADPNNFTSPTFNWYATPTSTTALQSTLANTFGSTVATTTTMYVTTTNPSTGCQSAQTPVIITVAAPPALSVSSPTLTTCSGVASPVLNVTGPAYNSFAWSPSAGVSGNATTGYTFTATAGTTYTLTASQTSGALCVNNATMALTVNVNPLITSATAAPISVCNTAPVNLAATSIVSGPQTQPTGYCASNATSLADEEILNVTLGSLNSSSTCTTTGGPGSTLNQYSNYTATIAAPNYNVGSTYNLSVEIGTCGGNYSNSTKVFIDYNRDGDFADAGEEVYVSSAAVAGPHIETATVTIPSTALVGVTRMRVVNVETTLPSGITPCGTYTWGETEDYIVNIQSVPAAVYTYAWNTTPVINGTTGSTIAVNTGANDLTASYVVTATDVATGCFSTLTTNNITVRPTPTINAGQNILVCSNNVSENITFNATGAGPAGTYAWTGPVSGVINGTPFAVSATGTYSVVGTTQYGCSNSDTLLVTYSTIPVAGGGVDQEICIGQTTSFTANGLAPFTWTSSLPASGVTTPVVGGTLTVTPTAPGVYTYNVGVGNSVGCTNDDQVQLTVWALPIVNAGVDQIICNASPAILSGSGALTYTWTNNVTNATPFFPSSTATYTVDGVDIHGCHNFDNVNVTVLPQPIVNGGIDQTICATTPVILFAQTTLNTPTAVTGFQWNNNVTNGQQFVPNATATYTVTATGANGCTNQDQVVVNVLALPTVNAGNDITVCAGLSATLNATGASSYVWNNGITQAIPFYPNATQTYTVTGTGANGCTNQDQVVVNVSTGPTVTVSGSQVICANAPATLSAASTNSMGGFWTTSNGTGVISPNVSNGTVTYTPSANDPVVVNLTYVASNACGNVSQSTSLTVLPIPTVNAGPDIASCAGLPVTLSATGNGFLTWNNGVTNNLAFVPSTSGTYTVTAVGANNCANTDQMNVTVLALPDVNAGADQTVCSGSNVTLTGSGANSYAWNNGVVNAIAFAPNTTQTYTVTGTAINGCQSSDNVVVTVNATPVALVSIIDDVTLAAAPAGMNYQWINCGSGTDIPAATTAQFTATVNGAYAVIVTSLQGCEDVSDCYTIDAVGLDQMDISGMNVFPNPTNGEVNVSLPENATVTVQIFDAQGKLVAEQANVSNNDKLNISSVTPGVYMVRLSAENAIQTFRVVKN